MDAINRRRFNFENPFHLHFFDRSTSFARRLRR
jgi:hypothetical protein